MTKISNLLGRFVGNKKGAVAIEFAFVFPIMIGAYLFLADVNIAINDNRRVSDIANSTAQVAATFPDYSDSTRAALGRSLDAYELFLRGRELSVQMASLEFKDGQLNQVFDETLRGEPAEENWWSDQIQDINYVEGDNVILVRAEINKRSYVSQYFAAGTSLSAVSQTQSLNSRSYVRSVGASRKAYYNWQ